MSRFIEQIVRLVVILICTKNHFYLAKYAPYATDHSVGAKSGKMYGKK